jgi:hypothetical protein
MTKKIICLAHALGRRHDFQLFKGSKTRPLSRIKAITDMGYLGLQKIHANTSMPKKSSKKNPLSKDDKAGNRALSRERIPCENVIGAVKRFRIVAEKYRNRRKRFGLRMSLIAAIYNKNLSV